MIRSVAASLLCALTLAVSAPALGATWSAQTHALYPGDFDGDNRADLLVISKQPGGLNGIFLSDGTAPRVQLQSWVDGYLGITWSDPDMRVLIGDIDGNGTDDLMLDDLGEAIDTGTVDRDLQLLTTTTGRITGTSKSFYSTGNGAGTLGDFDGNGGADLLMLTRPRSPDFFSRIGPGIFLAEPRSPSTTSSIVSLHSRAFGMNWDSRKLIVHAGDFNGDGRDDILLQPKSRPVATPTGDTVLVSPRLKARGFAILLADPTARFPAIHQAFDHRGLGANWDPDAATVLVGDLNEDGRDDVLLAARKAGQASYLYETDANGQLPGVPELLSSAFNGLAHGHNVSFGDFNGDGKLDLFRQPLTPQGRSEIYFRHNNTFVAYVEPGLEPQALPVPPVVFTPAPFVTPVAPAPVTAVGTLAGSAGVDALGNGTYSIPIALPDGTNGVVPTLAFEYNSASDDSWLGVGWSLSGLGAIVRCPRTTAQDGTPREIRGDLQDRFCLGGNRLRLTGGTYGVEGSTYQTEIESFARVTADGVAGNGPASFTVANRNGSISDFGASVDSQLTMGGGNATIFSWTLTQQRDRSGNVVKYLYDKDPANGTNRIRAIEYTSNPGRSVTAPYRVEFSYETRPGNEVDMAFVAGTMIRRTARMTRVEVKHRGELVSSYVVAYEPALSSTGRSRLASIQQCVPGSCVEPTRFTYQNGTPGLAAPVSLVPSPAYGVQLLAAFSTTFYASSATPGVGTWHINGAPRLDGSAVSAGFDTRIVMQNLADPIATDYEADGGSDLILPINNTWQLIRANAPHGPTNTGIPVTATGRGANAAAIDINGDGRDDLVWADIVGLAGGDAIRYRLREPSGTYSATVQTLLGPFGANATLNSGVFATRLQGSKRRAPDFNGDGRDDLMFYVTRRTAQGNVTELSTVLSGVAGLVSIPLPRAALAGQLPRFGDINGDGFSDLVYLDDARAIRVLMSTSTGVMEQPSPGTSTGGAITLLDWDHDGRDDVLINESTNLILFRANGMGLAAGTVVGPAESGVTSTMVVDVDRDGLDDFVTANGGAGSASIRTHLGSFPDFLTEAADGFGNRSVFQFVPSAYRQGRPSVYDGFSDPAAPGRSMPFRYLVWKLSESDGQTSDSTPSLVAQTFFYKGGRVDTTGRGFLGFSEIKISNDASPLEAVNYYNQQFPLTGTLRETRLFPRAGLLISRVGNDWATHTLGSGSETRVLPYLRGSTSTAYEFGGVRDGTLVATTVTTNQVDAATGVTTDSRTETTEEASANGLLPGAKYVTHTQVSDLVSNTATWCVGLPGTTKVTRSHNQANGEAVTRTVQQRWDTSMCRLTGSTREPGDAKLELRAEIRYDAFGNLNRQTLEGARVTSRTTTADWGSDGRFLRTATDALGQTARVEWDDKLALPRRFIDGNGVAPTVLQYDAFGRVARETRADGTYTATSYEHCVTYGCVYSNHRSTVLAREFDAQGLQITETLSYFDSYDRVIGSSGRTLNPSSSRNEAFLFYDALGHLIQINEPHFKGATLEQIKRSTFSYDDLGRRVTATVPSPGPTNLPVTSRTFYEGLTLRTVDGLQKQSVKIRTVDGATRRSIDHDGYYQQFDYDAFGNPRRVVDSLGSTLQTLSFDRIGQKLSQTDMDRGAHTYDYDALGQLLSSTDARAMTQQFEYDLLGQIKVRREPEGETTFTYGTSAAERNIGRLVKVVGPASSEAYRFDALGRLATRTITADGDHSYDFAYNPQGALDTLTYPVSTAGYRLALKLDYHEGRLRQITDANAPAQIFWRADGTNARGHISNEVLGNSVRTLRTFFNGTDAVQTIRSGYYGLFNDVQDLSYAYDDVSNLVSRTDRRTALTEKFVYDNLYRLQSSTLGTVENLRLTYDPMGNIKSKSDVGTYTYDLVKKHAVIAAGGVNYGYDAKGQMIDRGGQTVAWTSFGLPRHFGAVAGAPPGAPTATEFVYDHTRSRLRQTVSYPGGSSKVIQYIGELMQKETTGGRTVWRHDIVAPTGTVATYVRSSDGANERHYLVRDNLGGVDATLDAFATVESRGSFDAFGQRRNPGTWSGAPLPADVSRLKLATLRGFTDHEMLDDLGLTHMNGRVYDQRLGRFLSADPNIDGPGRTQGWNRYSYVANNPLSFIDPSGFGGEVIEEVIVTGSRDNPNRNTSGGGGFGGFTGGGSVGGGGRGGIDGGGGRGGGGCSGITCLLPRVPPCSFADTSGCRPPPPQDPDEPVPPPVLPPIVNPGPPPPLPIGTCNNCGGPRPLPLPNLPPPQVPDFSDGAPAVGFLDGVVNFLAGVSRVLGQFACGPTPMFADACDPGEPDNRSASEKRVDAATLVLEVSPFGRLSRARRIAAASIDALPRVKRVLVLGRGTRDQLENALGKSLGSGAKYSYRPNPKDAADIIDFNQTDILVCLKDPHCVVVQIRTGVPDSAVPGQPGFFSVEETKFLKQLEADGFADAAKRIIRVFDTGK